MTGSLQEKSGKYYAVLRVDGKQKWVNLQIPTTRGNKRRAEQALHELCLQYQNTPNMFKKFELTDYMKYWLTKIKGTIDSVTESSYKQHVNKHLIPFFQQNQMCIQDIKSADIENYYKYKAHGGRLDGKDGGLSFQTIKRHAAVLNLIFKQAKQDCLIKENPCEYAQLPTEINKIAKQHNFYDVNQCNNLLQITDGTTLYDMIYLTFIYGLRRSELMGLKWNAVNFENNTIVIQHTSVATYKVVSRKDKTKNQSSNRVYPLLDNTKNILLRIKNEQEKYKELFLDEYQETGYVFTKEDGSVFYPDYPSKRLKKIIKRNNLSYITWHDLRHSCASFLIEKGWGMKDISDWLGHSDISTTMNIYGHIRMDHKRSLGNSLNETFTKCESC